MEYLIHRTKSNNKLMMEMISIYLEQTPPLTSAMKQSIEHKDWDLLYSAVHKLIPSFSIMGIGANFENMAIKLQDLAGSYLHTNASHDDTQQISDLILQLERICELACTELTEELIKLKTIKNEN